MTNPATLSSCPIQWRSRAGCLAALLLFAGIVPGLRALPASAAPEFVVTDFGAVAGGAGTNTRAIQTAIDAAARKGGGTVVIPAGVFRSGSIFLKAGVGLRLDAGAVLLGSDHIEDYPKQRTRIEGHFAPWRMALVNAEGLEKLRISGPGRIDGHGATFWAAFWQRRKENPKCTNLEVERPRLFFIDRCRDVRIENLTLVNSGFWNIHLYHCTDVVIEGVDISVPGAPVRAPSTDGIDIDSSQRVTVRRCRIAVDDDCVALKGSKGPHADQDEDSPPVEDILIEQCEFARGNGVMTCGSEATVVRRATVRDSRVTGRAVLVCLKLRPDTPQLYEDLLFDGITFSGGTARIFQVAPWTQFFDLQGHPPPARTVKNVTVRNLSGEAGSFGVLSGNPGDVIRDLTLENIHLKLNDESLKRGPVENLVVRDVVINGQPVTLAPVP